MNSPHVSVIIPVFQPPPNFLDTVRSIQAQTHPALDILIIDDASTQPLPSVFASGVQVHRLATNSGSPALPREIGITQGAGEWIAFCDADDLWHPTKVQKQMELARKAPQIGAVATNANRVTPGSPPQRYFPHLPPTGERADLMRDNLIVTSSMMVRRDILMQCGSVPSLRRGVYEDLALWLRVASFTRIAFVDEPLVDYRDAPQESHRASFGAPLPYLYRTLANNRAWSRDANKAWTSREIAYAGVGLARAAKATARRWKHSSVA